MKNGTCPECNSTGIYVTNTQYERLLDDNGVYLAVDGMDDADVETYVCASCGPIRLFVTSKDLTRLAVGVRKSKPWKKIMYATSHHRQNRIAVRSGRRH